MGKAVKSITKTVTKSVKNIAKSAGKVVEGSFSSVKHLAQGDVKGAVRKITDVAAAGGNLATGGTMDFTGNKNGIINIDKNKYVDGVIGVNKVKTPSTPVSQVETDGLLQYVSDLRMRKARRSRASTNNTGGSFSSNDANKLSGTTALGV